MSEKMGRGEKAGEHMADSIIELCHIQYNHKTAQRIVNALVKRLQERVGEYVPVKKGETYTEPLMEMEGGKPTRKLKILIREPEPCGTCDKMYLSLYPLKHCLEHEGLEEAAHE